MTRYTVGNRGKGALIFTMFQAGPHSNTDNSSGLEKELEKVP